VWARLGRGGGRRGTARERDEPGMHDHGRAAGRLAEGGGVRERGRHHRPHVSGVGRCGGVKAHVRNIQGSQVHGAQLLAVAYRNHFHCSEFIGGDVMLTIPYKWQKRFNESDVEVMERMSKLVDLWFVGELTRKFPELRRAYEPMDCMS